MKMVEKSLSYFLEKLPLFFFLATLIPSIAFLCFLTSYGLFSLLITITILLISTYAFFTRFFSKNKTIVLCLVETSVLKNDDDDDYDDDDDDVDDVDDDMEEEEDGLIEIALMSEEAECREEMKKKQSLESLKVYKNGEEEVDDDVNMEEDNLIEIDIYIGSIKRPKT